jgi:hypothetical protein
LRNSQVLFIINLAKEKELQNIISELDSYKRRHISPTTDRQPQQQRSVSNNEKIKHLKQKLQQANQTIVQLIK